jgi:hypothetical protein
MIFRIIFVGLVVLAAIVGAMVSNTETPVPQRTVSIYEQMQRRYEIHATWIARIQASRLDIARATDSNEVVRLRAQLDAQRQACRENADIYNHLFMQHTPRTDSGNIMSEQR